MYWRDLSPHARELVLRMVLTQPPTYFRHVENDDPQSLQMTFVIDEDTGECCANTTAVFLKAYSKWINMRRYALSRENCIDIDAEQHIFIYIFPLGKETPSETIKRVPDKWFAGTVTRHKL